MDDNLTAIIGTLITVMFSGASWKFYEYKMKSKREDKQKEKSDKNIFRDDLINRVKKLESDKESCMDKLLLISQELSSLKTKVEFIEKENERLKYK